jgi:lysophospholipase L1-like esterase
MKYRALFGTSRRTVLFAFVMMILCFQLIFPSNAPSAAQTLNYTGLGDSIAFGAFAPPGSGYVPLYRSYLETDLSRAVNLYPLGVPGWTSYDLQAAVSNNFLFRLSIFYSDVVTWNIGGNDLIAARNQYKAGTCGGPLNQQCMADAVHAFKLNWDAIVTEILRLRRFRPTVIRTMTIYNPYVNIDKEADSWPGDLGNDFQVLKPYLDEVNAYIGATADANKIAYAPVYEAFNGPAGDEDPGDKGLIAFNAFHPNAAGHALIASLLRELGYVPIVPGF